MEMLTKRYCEYLQNTSCLLYLHERQITVKFKTRSGKFVSKLLGKLLTYYSRAAFPSGLSLHTEMY